MTFIEKNTPVPVERTRNFTTSKDYQTEVRIQVSQGESKVFADNERLGVLTLHGLPSKPRGVASIAVTFTIDADGILNVRARDLAGYSILQLLFLAPLVIFLSWRFARTLQYVPPMM